MASFPKAIVIRFGLIRPIMPPPPRNHGSVAKARSTGINVSATLNDVGIIYLAINGFKILLETILEL